MKQKQQQNPRTVAIGCATVFLCGLVFVGLFFYINHTYTAPFKQLARDICNEYGCDANDLINNHIPHITGSSIATLVIKAPMRTHAVA